MRMVFGGHPPRQVKLQGFVLTLDALGAVPVYRFVFIV